MKSKEQSRKSGMVTTVEVVVFLTNVRMESLTLCLARSATNFLPCPTPTPKTSLLSSPPSGCLRSLAGPRCRGWKNSKTSAAAASAVRTGEFESELNECHDDSPPACRRTAEHSHVH